MGHRSVLIWWQTAGKKALLCANTKMDMLCDMPLTSKIMNKTMQCKRGNNLNTLTLGSLETRINEVCGMSDYFKAFSCVVYEAWNLTYTKEVSSHFTFNNGRILPTWDLTSTLIFKGNHCRELTLNICWFPEHVTMPDHLIKPCRQDCPLLSLRHLCGTDYY